MSLGWQRKAGVSLVGEYQVSGHSFVVANATSARTINLNFLSSEITVIANEDGAIITFEDSGTNTRAITLPKGSHTFKVKCKKLVTNNKSMSLVISCTGIPAGDYAAPLFTLLGGVS